MRYTESGRREKSGKIVYIRRLKGSKYCDLDANGECELRGSTIRIFMFYAQICLIVIAT